MNKWLKLSISSCMLVCLFGTCEQKEILILEPGVSKEVAINRKARISKLTYDLKFNIPINKEDAISASGIINFNLKDNDKPLIIDFRADPGSVKSILVNGNTISTEIQQEHLVLSQEYLETGYNQVSIDFTAGDLSLNRNDDYLYTLFVPDRASSAFPCFDQPDLKAKFKLELEVPSKWQALSNAPVSEKAASDDRTKWTFDWSDSMSTYLFSFVAGVFEVESTTMNGIEMTMMHRELDTAKVSANKDSIFHLHREALAWMEDYTGIKYPFKKFEFVLIPGFQYGGMEHTGAIQYRASSLFLDESATLNDKISRSMLIAHETAHMWFGNLVTMKWFDDVWLKEVFANFMASKITEPNFPDINHDLNFLFSHYPQAYAVDRTSGANPIKQELGNLKNAGSMYGAIIYHKAPIAMKQLEKILGENSFKLALRTYLENFAGRNADWNDLIAILDFLTDQDLKKWSEVWIEGSGMPYIDLEFLTTETLSEYDIIQYDLAGGERVWPQHFTILFSYDDSDIAFPIFSDNVHYRIKKNIDTYPPQFIQLNSDGMGYGVFSYGLDYVKNEFLFHKARVDIPRMDGDLRRGAAYVGLNEYLLHEGMNPQLYLSFLEDYVREESDKLMISYLLNNLETVYWKFLKDEHRTLNVQTIETTLMNKLKSTEDKELKYLLLKKYIAIGYSKEAVGFMRNLWQGTASVDGVELSEDDKINLAMELAIKDPENASVILNTQKSSLNNKDKQDRLNFILPALLPEEEGRDAFFQSLQDPSNREHESWVLTALNYLHHPLRREYSIKYLPKALNMLEELQSTGDIFFPKRWLDNTLRPYNSSEAVGIVNDYLQENENMDPKLKQKVLQAADLLFKADRDISIYVSGE